MSERSVLVPTEALELRPDVAMFGVVGDVGGQQRAKHRQDVWLEVRMRQQRGAQRSGGRG